MQIHYSSLQYLINKWFGILIIFDIYIALDYNKKEVLEGPFSTFFLNTSMISGTLRSECNAFHSLYGRDSGLDIKHLAGSTL